MEFDPALPKEPLPAWLGLEAPHGSVYTLMRHATATLPLVSKSIAEERSRLLPGPLPSPGQVCFAHALNFLSGVPISDLDTGEKVSRLIRGVGAVVRGDFTLASLRGAVDGRDSEEDAGSALGANGVYRWSEFTERLAKILSDTVMTPVSVAAGIEHELFSLAPLTDGNVRVGRALATWVLFPVGLQVPRVSSPERYQELLAQDSAGWDSWYCAHVTAAGCKG